MLLASILDPIYKLFGWLMRGIYHYCSFGSYAIALIIFTVLTKLLLMPLTIKQQKSARQTQAMQEEMQEIQRLYKGDRERIAEETQKLYTKYGVNPMAGCLPLLIQFPLIIVLYAVVREPIKYILNKPDSIIKAASGALGIGDNSFYPQLEIMNRLTGDPSLVNTLEGFTSSDIINFKFLGINLGMNPTFNFTTIFSDPKVYLPLLLIPIFAALTTFLQSKLMTSLNQKRQGNQMNDQAQAMNKSLSIFMPLMILVFAFSVPAALGFYWIIGNIFQIVQQIVLNYVLNRKDPQRPGRIIETKGRKV